MPRVDKVIVTNDAALRLKYLERYQRVKRAIRELIAADAARGVITRLVALDDEKGMRRLRGVPVSDAGSERENKEAIDAVCRFHEPDYVMILGAPDIVPHQNLLNPLYAPGDDDDRFAFSDLPYACEEPFSQRVADFRGPTRVVGRLPDLFASGDAGYLVRLLRRATTARRRKAADYSAFFGLTAEAWRQSTTLSMQNMFSELAVPHRSPPEGPAWRASQLGALTHFINCHGGSNDPQFYGQRGESYPIAMDAPRLEGKVKAGTVVAAECCFGAQLYDPSIPEEMGICNRYLAQGAYAFFGSSTIAYGPSEGNGSADLICQFFIQRVLAGASTGRAALEARIRFIMHATHLDPTDLKTLAQFNLMGDPSIHVTGKVVHALQKSKGWSLAFRGDPERVGREQRRRRLIREGHTLGATTGSARPSDVRRPSAKVRRALEKALRDAGTRPRSSFAFGVDDPARRTLGRARVENTTPQAFYVMSGTVKPRGSPIVRHVVAIATVQNGQVVRLRRLHGRG